MLELHHALTLPQLTCNSDLCIHILFASGIILMHCTQVCNKTGITDIGLAASPASYGFFGKCGFDLDREQSTFMAFAAESINTSATDRLQANTSLLQLLVQT